MIRTNGATIIYYKLQVGPGQLEGEEGAEVVIGAVDRVAAADVLPGEAVQRRRGQLQQRLGGREGQLPGDDRRNVICR